MIFLGSDHAGFALKEQIKANLNAKGINYTDLTEKLVENDDYPDVALNISQNLGSQDLAIAICGTGQGICIALNRFKKIRAVCSDKVKIIKLTRSHNHANVLCLPGRFIKPGKAIKVVYEFLQSNEDFSPRHTRRINKIS